MNLTLSIDKATLERARKLAQGRGTTVNQMVRDFLREITLSSSSEMLLKELDSLWSEESGDSSGREWKREDLYDRPILH